MFTGIIRHFGCVKYNHLGELVVQVSPEFSECHIGDSVCVNGICLTITKVQQIATDVLLYFYIMNETIKCTTAGTWACDQIVNIELGVCADQRLDGHVTTGHITHTGQVSDILQTTDASKTFLFKVQGSEDITQHIVKKGSICIDGVSLTVVQTHSRAFSVCIIPHTLENTVFKYYTVGTLVNIEVEQKHGLVDNSWDIVLSHEHAMHIAMQTALLGRFTAPPNPWVGCVIVCNTTRKIVARGHHITPGTPHAEIHALNMFDTVYSLGNRYSMYVTLEPCSHYGRTPPCVNRIFDYAGVITHVYIGMCDPDSRVASSGARALESKFTVVNMNCARVCEMYRGYTKHRLFGKPYIIFKIATTWDMCTVTFCNGSDVAEEKYITSRSALADVHKTRANCDAIITTTRTVHMDRPKLNVRNSEGDHVSSKPVWVVGTTECDTSCIQSDSITCVKTIQELLEQLATKGHFVCLIEGGLGMYMSLLEHIDEIHWYCDTKVSSSQTGKWNPPGSVFKPVCSEVFDTTVKIVYSRDAASRLGCKASEPYSSPIGPTAL